MGICSTTYGDLVCRGCKRFAHEIVEWNSYDQAQRETVWHRLEEMRAQVFGQALMITDIAGYLGFCRLHNLSVELDVQRLHEVLTLLVRESAYLSTAGLQVRADQGYSYADSENPSALEVVRVLDQAIYKRAQAHYERNFRIVP